MSKEQDPFDRLEMEMTADSLGRVADSSAALGGHEARNRQAIEDFCRTPVADFRARLALMSVIVTTAAEELGSNIQNIIFEAELRQAGMMPDETS